MGDAIFDAQLKDSESCSLFHDLIADDRYPNGDIVITADFCELVGPAQVATAELRWPPATFVHPVAVATTSVRRTAGQTALLPERCRRLVGALDCQRPQANLGFGTQVQIVRIHRGVVTRRNPSGGLGTAVEITFGLGEP